METITQPDKEAALGGLAIINAALSPAMQYVIESMTNPDPKQRRGIDFVCLDRAWFSRIGFDPTQ